MEEPTSPLTSLFLLSAGAEAELGAGLSTRLPCTPASIGRGRSSGEGPGFTLKQLISKTSRRMSHELHCWPRPCPSPGLSVASILGLARGSYRSRGFRTCPDPGQGRRLGWVSPSRGTQTCASLHTQRCWKFLRDVAMTSRAIPGRVDPGSSRQDPAALTPNKQSGGHRHIPGRSLGTAGVLSFLFIPIPRRGTSGVWAAGCPGDWRHPKPEVAPGASRGAGEGGASPVSTS